MKISDENGVTSTSLSNYNNSYDIITFGEFTSNGNNETSTHVIDTDVNGNIYVLGAYNPTLSYPETLDNLFEYNRVWGGYMWK